MRAARQLRIGIAGKRGASHVAGLRSAPEVFVAAVCETDPAALERVSAEQGIPKRFRDFGEMAASDLDAILIATPMHLHVAQAIVALAAGQHVLCEVTAAVSLDECAALAAAVRASGKRYMLAENYIYTRENMLVRSMARAGLFGTIYYAEGGYIHDCHEIQYDAAGNPTWRVAWQVGRNGCTYGTHSLGPVLEWLGDRLATVSCLGSGVHTVPAHKMDDTVTMLGKTTRGALVNIRCDMQSHRPHNMTHYALQGTRGAYQSARRRGEPNLVWVEGRSPDAQTWQRLEEYESEFLPEPWRTHGAAAVSSGHGGGDYLVARDFVLSILDDREPPIDAYRALDFTAPGLVSEESIFRGGVPLPVPDYRAPAQAAR